MRCECATERIQRVDSLYIHLIDIFFVFPLLQRKTSLDSFEDLTYERSTTFASNARCSPSDKSLPPKKRRATRNDEAGSFGTLTSTPRTPTRSTAAMNNSPEDVPCPPSLRRTDGHNTVYNTYSSGVHSSEQLSFCLSKIAVQELREKSFKSPHGPPLSYNQVNAAIPLLSDQKPLLNSSRGRKMVAKPSPVTSTGTSLVSRFQPPLPPKDFLNSQFAKKDCFLSPPLCQTTIKKETPSPNEAKSNIVASLPASTPTDTSLSSLAKKKEVCSTPLAESTEDTDRVPSFMLSGRVVQTPEGPALLLRTPPRDVVLGSDVSRGRRWTQDEDQILKNAIEEQGGPPYKWKTVSIDYFYGTRNEHQVS